MHCEIRAVKDTLDYIVSCAVAGAVDCSVIAEVPEVPEVIFVCEVAAEDKMNKSDDFIKDFKNRISCLFPLLAAAFQDQEHSDLMLTMENDDSDDEELSAKRVEESAHIDAYWSQFHNDLKRKHDDSEDINEFVDIKMQKKSKGKGVSNYMCVEDSN